MAPTPEHARIESTSAVAYCKRKRLGGQLELISQLNAALSSHRISSGSVGHGEVLQLPLTNPLPLFPLQTQRWISSDCRFGTLRPLIRLFSTRFRSASDPRLRETLAALLP